MTVKVMPVHVVELLLDCCEAIRIVDMSPNEIGRSISLGVDCLWLNRFMISEAIGVKLPMTVTNVTLMLDSASINDMIDATSRSDASCISFGSLNILGSQ